MLFIKELYLENFKSFKSQKIGFMLGRNIILGRNGAGKTTILMAILYSLFGKVSRLGKDVNIEDLVRSGKDGFKIELTFQIDDDEYIVERQNFIGYKEPIAYLWKNHKLIAEKQTAVTNEITEILKIDRSTFENVVYVGQGEISQIALKTPGERKKIFDLFLNLDVYETIYKKLRDVSKDNESEIKILNTRINDLERDTIDLPDIEKKLASTQKRLKTRKEEEKKLIKELEKVKGDFEKEDLKKKELDRLDNTIKIKTNLRNDIDNTILDKKKKAESILKKELKLEKEELKKDLKKLKDNKDSLEKSKEETEKIIKFQEKIAIKLESIEKRIVDNKNSQNSNLNTIKNNKNAILTDKPELNKTELSEWGDFINSRLDAAKKKINELELERSKVLDDEKLKGNLEERLKTQKSNLKKQENNYSKVKKSLEKIDRDWKDFLETNLKIDLNKMIKDQEKNINGINKEINTLNKQLAVIKHEIENNNSEIDKITKLKEGVLCPRCKQKVSGDHKKKIIEEIEIRNENIKKEMETINAKLKEFSDELSNKEENKKELQDKKDKLSDIKPLADNHQDLKSQIEQSKQEIRGIKSEINEITIEKSLEEYNEEISITGKEKDVYSNISHKFEMLLNAENKLKELQQKLDEIETEKKNLTKDYDPKGLKKARENQHEIGEQYNNITESIPIFNSIIERIDEKNNLDQELETLSSKIAEINSTFDVKRYKELKELKINISNQIEGVKSDIKIVSKEIIPELENRIADMKNKIKELNEKKSDLEKEKKKSSLINFLRSFSREITPILRSQKTKLISDKASDIFLEFTGHTGDFEGISITDNYDLYVRRFGFEEDITNLSGGERVISCLAIRLAISEILANQGLILLDEPTAHLDDTRIKDLVAVFEMYSPVNQMITVTHDKEFEKIGDSLIQVYKDSGVSEVIEI